ncbi:BON domain-containing protein [Fontivita pretiosa]|uniref:BON domain-containing protein n=1 Tax=Fontivita pretiosa TaxID=2989684 RepID=UPI003D16DB75
MKRAFEDGVALLLGAGLGMAAMYLLDPQSGARRRRRIGRRASELLSDTSHSLSRGTQQVLSRISGGFSGVSDSDRGIARRMRRWSAAAMSEPTAAASRWVRGTTQAASEQYRKLPSMRELRRLMQETIRQSLPALSSWRGRERRWTHDQSGSGRYRAASGIGGAIGLIALGAGMAYLFDPQQGRARRAYLRDKLISFANDTSEFVRRSGRHLSNRIQGSVAEGRGWFGHEQVDDEQLAERVRSAIGRAGVSSSQVQVSASHGHVTLRGSLPRDQIKAVATTAYRVRGVRSIDCQITPAEPGDVVGRSQTTTGGSPSQGPSAPQPTLM